MCYVCTVAKISTFLSLDSNGAGKNEVRDGSTRLCTNGAFEVRNKNHEEESTKYNYP